MDKYTIKDLVGEGSFGQVYRAVDNKSNQIVALKIIGLSGRSGKEITNLRGECDIQKNLCHPNIIKMIHSFETNNKIIVVTEFAYSDLHKVLGKEGSLGEDRTQKISYDLLSALYYLHSHRILHRDLKPQNILLDKQHRAKLCDFGLARNMTIGTHVLTSIKGTPLYMAPELMSEKPYDFLADLWSLGCIIYEMLAGEPPFSTTSYIRLYHLVQKERIRWPSFLTTDCITFLQGLLEKQPSNRMKWADILEHPFVKGNILILNEDKVTSPFTHPLSESQTLEKELQKEQLLQRNQKEQANLRKLSLPKDIAIPKKTNSNDDNLVSSRESVNVHMCSDMDNIETDVDEASKDTSTKEIPIAEKIQNPVCFVSGNSNLIVNHYKDNFPSTEMLPSTSGAAKIHMDTNKNSESQEKTPSIGKSLNKPLEKKKLNNNLSNMSVKLGHSKDSDKSNIKAETKSTNKSGAAENNENKVSVTRKEISPPEMQPGWDSCDVYQNPPIENEEWLAFLQKSMQEVLDGELDSLKEQNMVSIIVAPLRNFLASPKVVQYIAELLSLPLIIGAPQDAIMVIRDMYYEVKLVSNLIYASKLLCTQRSAETVVSPLLINSPFRTIETLSSAEIKTLSSLYELVCHLVHLNDRFLSQLCDAIVGLRVESIFTDFLSTNKESPEVIRLANTALALLNLILRELPENADVVEKIIFGRNTNLLSLLKHKNPIMRWRTCILLRLLGKYSCSALQRNWNENLKSTMAELTTDSFDKVRNEMEIIQDEFKDLSFY